jgi:hypothetical protein
MITGSCSSLQIHTLYLGWRATRYSLQLRHQTPALCYRGQGLYNCFKQVQYPHLPERTLVTNTTLAFYDDWLLTSNLVEHTCSGNEIESHSIHIKRNLSNSENDGNQKVIFQGLDASRSSHWIMIGQPVQFFPKQFSLATESGPCHLRSL